MQQKTIRVYDNYGIYHGTVSRTVVNGYARVSRLRRAVYPLSGVGLGVWLGPKAKLPGDLRRAR